MYNDTIKVSNKIISDTDLLDIFQKMNEEMIENEKICKKEQLKNEMFEREYQHWTAKSFEGSFKCTFNFYDDTNITVDNYNSFITLFNNRLHEIKDMFVRYHFRYYIQHGRESDFVTQHINMSIYEHKMNIDVSLSSADKKMDDVFKLIKSKILNAPEKYDRIIKKKNFICSKIGFAFGIFPSLIVCTLLAFIPTVRNLYGMTYVLFPFLSVFLAFFIGNTFFSGKLGRLYFTISPKQMYAGWDSLNHKSTYKDDIDDFISKSEIIIGKNVDNLKNRKEIVDLENKYSRIIPIGLGALLVLSIVVIILGKVII